MTDQELYGTKGRPLPRTAYLAHWPTTTTTDSRRQPSLEATTPNITLNHAANLATWPTPRMSDGEKNVRTLGGGRPGDRQEGEPAGSRAVSLSRGLADSQSDGRGTGLRRDGSTEGGRDQLSDGDSVGGLADRRNWRPGSTNGFWEDVDWLFCRDGKWRPVEPGTFPLAHGARSRVGRLRAYGNAINKEAGEGWIGAFLDFEEAGGFARMGVSGMTIEDLIG